jgi:hypothetical protein
MTAPSKFFLISFFTNIQWLGLPLWSSGQSSLATDPEVRVRFPALPDFLKSSGSGRESSGSGLESEITAVGISRANSADKRRSVGRYSSLAEKGQGVWPYRLKCWQPRWIKSKWRENNKNCRLKLCYKILLSSVDFLTWNGRKPR